MSEILIRSFQSDPYYTTPVSAPLPKVPFTQWKLGDARRFVAQHVPPERAWAMGMYHGDHWQGGWGWAGPIVPMDDPGYARLQDEIRRMFCSRNVIREIVETHVDAVLARPLRWSLSPIRAASDERDETPDGLKELIAEASVFVRQWLDSRKAHQALRKLLVDLLMPGGRGVLRLFLPRGGGQPLEEGSRVLAITADRDFSDTMARIYLEKPEVQSARVYTDPETMRDIGITFFKARTEAGGEQDAATLVFLDASGERTIIMTVYEDGGSAAVGYRLGGRLTTYQAERDPLVTAQLLQQQRILNYAESIIPRNLTTAGFMDRVIMSSQMNGEWVVDEETGKQTYVMDRDAIPSFGPTEVTILQPIVLEDDEGRLSVTTPSMDRGQPVDPTGSIESSDHLYHNMLREAGQGHLVPGEESEAAKVRYGLSLLASAIPITAAMRWMVSTALAWGEALAGEPGRYTDRLRVQASCFLNVGKVTPEERAALTAAFEKSLLSRESAQEQMGVEDVDEENDRIAAQPGAAIDLAIRKANSFKMLREAGLPVKMAALHSGYSDDEAADMEKESEAEERRLAKEQERAIRLQASLAPKPSVGARGTGAAGLRSRRQGRPSGTAERNPGQQQDRGARALQSKRNNRSEP